MNNNKLVLCIIFSLGLMDEIKASPEKYVNYFFHSISKSRWLSSSLNKDHNLISLKEDDDFYKAIRQRMIHILNGKKIHSLTYVNYPDEDGIAKITDYSDDSVEIRLVNIKIAKTSIGPTEMSRVESNNFASEWNRGREDFQARLLPPINGTIHEDMLQLRIKGLILAFFEYETKADKESIIFLEANNIITADQAIMAGIYYDYKLEQSYRLFINKYAADWSKRNNIQFVTWRSTHLSLVDYLKTKEGFQSKVRWKNLIGM